MDRDPTQICFLSFNFFVLFVIRPVAFGVPFLHSQIPINDQVVYVFFTTVRWKEAKEIEIGN